MRTITQVIFLAVLLLTGCSTTRNASISFRDQAGWVKKGAEWYQISRVTGIEDLTLFYHWPDRRGEAANSMLRWEHLPEQFSGKNCNGRYYLNSADPNDALAIFMIKVDDTLWSGRFKGTAQGWSQALTLLKSAEKNGWRRF